jgi:hypothetical protein
LLGRRQCAQRIGKRFDAAAINSSSKYRKTAPNRSFESIRCGDFFCSRLLSLPSFISPDAHEKPEPLSDNGSRKINESCHGAPKLFSYPEPPAISEEERRNYREIAERLPKPKRKGRGRR